MNKRIKKTYICKDIAAYTLDQTISEAYAPVAGDVAVFEVLRIGKHKNVQGEAKRNITIVPGDWIMAAFGTRYATEQFEGYLPQHANQELHILGAGGTVGILESAHARFKEVGPTSLRMVGWVRDLNGQLINTKEQKQKYIHRFTGAAANATRVVLSLGSSMDSGKTTTAAYLVHGLKKAGLSVAYVKLTGTVYTKDADLCFDMGADMVTDFGDFGFPSTYMCNKEELLNLYESCLSKVLAVNPDFVIMEIADGIFERETHMLLSDAKFRDTVDHVIFSAGDSLAAVHGVQTLVGLGYFPAALCGLFTASPLLVKEVKKFTEVPVYTLQDISSAAVAESVLGSYYVKMTV